MSDSPSRQPNPRQPASRQSVRTGVAPRLYDLLVHLFGIDPPVRLVAWDGSVAGSVDGPVVRVHSRRAVRRLLWAPGELGLARAYVAGELEIEGDLVTGLRTLADYGALVGSRPQLRPSDRREVLRTAVLVGAVGPAPKPPEEEQPQRASSPRGVRERVASDLPADGGLELLEDVLGPSLAYSSAHWGAEDRAGDRADGTGSGTSPDLGGAQRRKLDVICDRLGLRPGARLLDLGCGWGPLLVHAVVERGVQAVGLVRSADRVEVVRRRLEAAGVAGRADVRLGDVEAVEDGPYDAVAIVESVEHVDEPDLLALVARVQQLLRPGGRLVLQAITARPGDGTGGPTFMSSYVMPGGPLPPVGTVVGTLEDAGLEVRLLESWREHYVATMGAWLDRLDADPDRAERVLGARRLRVWRLSLALGAVGFERGRIGLHHLLAVRPHADGHSGMLARAGHPGAPP